MYPSPLCWGATFDPDLIERMAAQIGATMRRLGVHQGLAPVLDVLRDLRWGRAEETIGEDPYLVGVIGSGYVRGLESAGVVATLKHFAGYSASRGGRNLAPVSIGPRELADVLLPPFEMALRAGARSVMNSYSDLDGVPAAADPGLLTGLLREDYGFTGTVVSDYFAVAFLLSLHGVAGTRAEAAGLALRAGIDVELPTVGLLPRPAARRAGGRGDRYRAGRPGRAAGTEPEVRAGPARPGLVAGPRARRGGRVRGGPAAVLDDRESRSLARDIARQSIVLLANQGTLPLAPGQRIAVVGPRAHEASAMLGCYSFPQHVVVHYPGVPLGDRGTDRAGRTAGRPGRIHGELRARLPGAGRGRHRPG